jgi:formylglycine-generating enzyme required for sulfatase activity
MKDPRIGTLLGKDGLPMKRTTGSFPGCTNEYGVYDMLGNVHEIVSDIREVKRFPKIRVTYVGSHYARPATESCAEATLDHGNFYTDYSIGFRCCKDL